MIIRPQSWAARPRGPRAPSRDAALVPELRLLAREIDLQQDLRPRPELGGGEVDLHEQVDPIDGVIH
jgi:hypothetical protein